MDSQRPKAEPSILFVLIFSTDFSRDSAGGRFLRCAFHQPAERDRN